MDKETGAYKPIGEVSNEINVPAHILCFWESKFDRLKLIKRKNNHRYYNLEDISFLKNIKKLINEEGYTIKGAQTFLKKSNILKKKSYNQENTYLDLINLS